VVSYKLSIFDVFGKERLMKFSYYPGCTLKSTATDFDESARLSANVLGIELSELKEWQCCGGVYTMGKDEVATKLASVRALVGARKENSDLVTLCSACHHVLKRVNNDMRTSPEIRDKANRYLELSEPYCGETEVIHFLELLRDKVGFDKIKDAVKNSIDKKIGAYYGCLLLRPSSVLAFDNSENPSIIEDFLLALGATPVKYPYRNECCGGFISLKEGDMSKNMCEKIVKSAKSFGADMLVTACPLCKYNLEKSTDMPVYYFTELLAHALGVCEL